MNTAELVRLQLVRYPRSCVQDLLKALYQSVLGCGHFAPDEAYARECLARELSDLQKESHPGCLCEELGAYSRVHLAPMSESGLEIQTLLKLFLLSAEAETKEARERYLRAVDELEALGRQGELPFPKAEFLEQIAAHRAQGCPSLRHTETFRKAYAPAYRVIRAGYADLLPLFTRIDAMMRAKEHVIVAIDGFCGSGKSSLARLLERVYGAQTLHMDDFFLQPHQRTPERFATPGENVDHERFLEEVLLPLSKGKAAQYRRYDCHKQQIEEGTLLSPGRLCVVEGTYSLHELLSPYADLRVLMSIDAQVQSERILARNGVEMHARFMNEWIPLENLYFEKTKAESRCDVRIHVLPQADGHDRFEVTA